MRIFENAATLKESLPHDTTFTLVGGCFDLIHVGHIHLLEHANTLEKMLVVAVLSDASVRGYKKSGRPIINERQRAVMVGSIRFVDFVFISDTNPNGPETLALLKPNSVVFGEETSETSLVRRRENIAAYSPHTKVQLLPRYTEELVSTSIIIDKIRKETLEL